MLRVVSIEALSEETLELRVRMSRGEWEALGKPTINDTIPLSAMKLLHLSDSEKS